MNDNDIARLLKHDFSKGTEAFADSLLTQALSLVNKGSGVELSDDDLDMLAAAGEASLDDKPDFF